MDKSWAKAFLVGLTLNQSAVFAQAQATAADRVSSVPAGSKVGAKSLTATAAFVPLVAPEDAWRALPKLVTGNPGRLPRWALATASVLPQTTAAVMELEYAHRAASPLEARCRAEIRYVAAHANQCLYTQAQAAADLRRAGVSDDDIHRLGTVEARLSPLLRFARKMTLAAYSVTDAEFAELARSFGDKQMVAIVQLLAFANFQDRLVLSLGIADEPNGPLPPLNYRFLKEARSQPRAAWPKAVGESRAHVQDAEWQRFTFGDLKKRMEIQKERPPRVPVPSWDDVKKNLPAELQNRELRIKWSLVCTGYQPELAQGWSACTKAFRTEAAMDRVFEESLFWVVTRTLQCFY